MHHLMTSASLCLAFTQNLEISKTLGIQFPSFFLNNEPFVI